MKILFTLLYLLLSPLLMADANLPSADLKGAKDVPYVGRYEGSKIVAYKHSSFDRFILPLAPLEAIRDKRDTHNNTLFVPKKSKTLEGEHTRLVYILPTDRTPLEVLRNYEEEIQSKKGNIFFKCEKNECGGDAQRASSGGGGDMSLSMFMQNEETVNSYNEAFSNGSCALLSRINDQHYLSATLPEENVFLSILTYTISDDSFCKAFNHKTVAVVDVLKIKKREQKMVVLKASQMHKAINKNGKIALYGIYFDSNKALIKKASKPTLDEIAKMLKENKTLKILIVGHTDNDGKFTYNQKLSEKRAKAVVHALHQEYAISLKRLHGVGVSYACPAASNHTEEGKAKNRRVVLVEDK